MAVVKANAYGHGDIRVAERLMAEGVRLFATATLGEAVSLRRAGISGEILVLGYTPIKYVESLTEYDITQTLVSEEYAAALSECAAPRPKCQFAIDTGMHRIGIDSSDAVASAEIVRKYSKKLKINGIFTHLATADGEDGGSRAFAERQLAEFSRVAELLSDLDLEYVHCLNSAGGINLESVADKYRRTVRLGILLYGVSPSGDGSLPSGIQPVLAWKTVIAAKRYIKRGDSVGYGRGYIADTDRVIATLPVGYADGYSRALSGKAHVLINGECAPVVGRICMDQTMVDITELSDAELYGEAVLIGKSGDRAVTADSLGRKVDTIGYEILTDISPRLSRIYYN